MKISPITYSLFTIHYTYENKKEVIGKSEEVDKRRITTNHFYGGVAQLGEHLPCKQGVMGSNPIISTKEQTCSKVFIENRIRKKKRNR